MYGAAYAWGQNSKYQLGTNSGSTPTNAPGAVVNPSGVPYGFTALSGGAYHSLGILNGAAYAWGNNDYAQLGNGNTSSNNASSPAPVPGLNAVSAVSAGFSFNLAIQNGTVYAWGYNSANQIGDPSLAVGAVELSPKAVTGLPTSGATTIATGSAHSLAIVNGAVWSWGYNTSLQLGYQTASGYNVTPTQVPGLGAGTGVTAITGGNAHSLAIKNGSVIAWGNNYYGQLGTNAVATRSSSSGSTQTAAFVAVNLSGGVTAISAGSSHNLAILNGKVYAWGYNSCGQLGYGFAGDSFSTTPQVASAPNMPTIVAVAATSNSSYALGIDGSIWAWGDNTSGELGLGTSQVTYSTPTKIPNSSTSTYCALMTGPLASHALAIQFYPSSTFFNNEAYLGGGIFYLSFANGNYFGYYSFYSDPHYFYHLDMGGEYIYDAKDGANGVYLFDYNAGHWFYTSPTYPFPYLYDFTLNSVLYYYPNTNSPGRYTTSPRYFYNFNTSSTITQ